MVRIPGYIEEKCVDMNKKIIIVEGYLASGKSTFAKRLSEQIKIPCLIKDTFKMGMVYDNTTLRNWYHKLSFKTVDMIHFEKVNYIVGMMELSV